MREIPLLQDKSDKGEKRLKREVRVSFPSGAGGVGLFEWPWTKSSAIVRVGDFHRANQPLSQGIVFL